MNSLEDHKVYQVQKGRMLKDDELAKDVIAVGLQNLTAGEKNPLAEYNAAVKRLQKRRNMNPVTLTVPSGAVAHAPTPQPVPPTPSETSQFPFTVTAEVVYDEGSPVPEEMNEVEQILDELERGVVEETLPRLTEDDVAYDMDEILVEEDGGFDSDDSDSSEEEESDINWEEEG